MEKSTRQIILDALEAMKSTRTALAIEANESDNKGSRDLHSNRAREVTGYINKINKMLLFYK